MRRLGIFNKVSCLLATLFSSISVIFGSWVIINNDTSADVIIEKTEDKAICYNKNTKAVYTSLKTALDRATSNQEIIVYIGANITCTDTITIKQGVTLTIPFVGKAYDSSKTGNNIGDTTLYKISDVDDRNNFGNTLGDINAAAVSKYRSSLIMMRSGADIINNGVLNLGGASTYCGNNGYYSEINLGSGSSITCNFGSTFNCYGYIKENFGEQDSSDAKNAGMDEYKDVIDNSFDAERFLLIKNGAVLNTNLAMYDVLSGGGLTGMLNAKQSPFNVFDFQSLQTYSTFETGSKMNGTAIVNGPNSMSVMKELPVISSNTSSAALLYLTEGHLSFEYKGTSKYSSRTTSINGMNIVIDGTLEMGYLYLSEGGGQIKMDTREFHLPMSSKISMYVTSSGKFNCDKKIKFLMGSKLEIREGGEFYVNENIAFYNKDVAPQKDNSSGIYYDSTGKNDAELINNGLIKINQDSSNKGYLGAIISHNSKTGSGKLDFSSISSAENLSSTLEEGTAGIVVTITSSGYFMDDTIFKAQFLAGTVYTSDNNGENYYWNGTAVSTVNIVVNVDNNVINPVLEYSITLSKTADGSSPYNSELVEKQDSGFTSISRGIYFNLVVNDAYSVSITKNNVEIPYNSSKWLYADSDFNIDIVPSEGVEVYVTYYKDTTYSDKEDTWMQGTGHVISYLQESETLNGTYTETFRKQTATFTKYVKKGHYFKVGYTWDSSDTMINVSGNNGYTATNKIYTNDSSFEPQPATSWDNKNTSNLSDAFLAGNDTTASGLKYTFELGYYSGHAKANDSGGCLLPSSLVLMADGTYKQAGLIKTGDMVMSFNHETGKIEPNVVIGNDDVEKPASLYNVVHLEFANGKSTDLVYEHGYFDKTLNQYVYLHENDSNNYIGHEFVFIENGKITTSKLIRTSVSKMFTKLASPATANHLNIIVDDMLTMAGGLDGLFNIFEYNPDTLAFDYEKMQQDIDKYGLLGYEYFEKYIPEEIYKLLPCKYLGVSIGKGLITWDVFEGYVDKWKDQLLENIK